MGQSALHFFIQCFTLSSLTLILPIQLPQETRTWEKGHSM